MCDLRSLGRAVLVTALVAAAAPRGARAQQPAAHPTREELLERIQDLEQRIVVARLAARHADSIALVKKLGGDPIMVQVGYLKILTAPAQADEARTLWQQEWDVFGPILGETGRRLSSFSYDRRVLPGSSDEPSGTWGAVAFHRPVSDRTVRAAIHRQLGFGATRLMPPQVRAWVTGGGPLGADIPTDDLYRQFVRAPTSLAQSCVNGSIQGCWTAFGEMDPSADLIGTWYPPVEQQAWTARLATGPRSAAAMCQTGSATACRSFFQSLDNSTFAPFPVALRASLLWYALERGGAGSVDRFIASVESDGTVASDERPGTAAGALGPATHIREHLGRAANMDPDVLMGLWRDRVLSGRPASPAPDEPTRAHALLWITLFAGLATRSTRWRLG